MSIINPRLFLVDENIKLVEEDQSVDLLASNVPKVGTGKYVCFEYRVPSGQILVVGGLAVYAKQRINVGATNANPPAESNQYIDPEQGSGWFSFEPQVNDAAAYNVNLNFAAPRQAGGTLNNNDRQRRRGISMLSKEPRMDAHFMWQNPLYKFLVPSDAVLRVVFELLPNAKADALASSGRYTIGAEAEQSRRVDYAGVYLVGQQMAATTYKRLESDARRE